MSIAAKTLADLGWSQLVDFLARRTHTRRGEAEAHALVFFDEPELAADRIAEIAEARYLSTQDAALPFGGIQDVVTPARRAEKGGTLDAGELLAVAATGRGLGRLKKHLTQHQDDAVRLSEIAAAIVDLRHVWQPIASAFDAKGELADHASEALGPLRRKYNQLKSQLEQRMRRVVDDSRYSKHLQDRFYTTREDRYVIPVRVDARSQVRGIIHGTSGSGQTVFIEPDEIVELNNRVKLAECDVHDEEQRILAELSSHVGADADALCDGLDASAHLDLIAAGAVLADDLSASAPTIDADGRLSLSNARHPLMVLTKGECVPNDIALEPRSILIISGPNAGGKTVALKTAGLAALMVRAGLHVAAEAGSVVPWFESVHSDIGDSQSIENDLSTFSAHLVQLRSYLAEAGPGTLLLVDEIAVGTEPEQGAALAEAVLESLAGRGVPAIVTTHYERLKALGARGGSFANASVGFDLDTMEPTFRLHLGVPGSSGALAVARRMGLPDDVVDHAQSLMGERRASIEELLAEVSDERRRLVEDRARLAETLSEAERTRKQAEVARDKAREAKARLEKSAHTEAVAALRRARAELDDIRSAVRKRAKDGKLGETKARITQLASAISEHEPKKPRPQGTTATADNAPPGTRVFVVSLGQSGEVTSAADRGKVTVQVGTMRIAVALDDLLIERASGGPARASAAGSRSGGSNAQRKRGRGAGSAQKSGWSSASDPCQAAAGAGNGTQAAVRSPDVTIDVRGERADEAVDSVDRFIDKCLLSMRDAVFIIHGHGTGALRSAIRSHLEGHHAVSNWRPGERSEGGNGVTIAWLDSD